MEKEKKLNIIGMAIKLIFAVPALILTLIVMTSNVTGDSDKLVIQEFMNNTAFTGAMNITLWTIFIAAGLILIFFFILLISRPKDAIKSIMGIIISGVIYFVLYLVGTNDTIESLGVQGDVSVTAGGINFTHAGIYTVLILLVIASLLAVGMGSIMRFIKN
ncbi:MAG: hypothetical protein WC994_07700 [Brumimicrobium sp.]